MAPLLAWAEGNRKLQAAAAVLNDHLQRTPQHASVPEAMTAAKLICMIVGGIAVLAMTFGATWFTSRHNPRLWWLGGVVVLEVLYTSYASRAELNLWYPYDLPHFAVFGLATLCILEEAWLPFAALFLIDIPIRETSIYLALLAAVVALHAKRRDAVLMVGGLVLAAWLPLRLWITHRYAHNPSETGVRWIGILHAVADPLHWPQVLSAGGFLLIPLWLGRSYLSGRQRVFLFASLPCFVVTLLFGMWYESRIFGEWTVAIALLTTAELDSILSLTFGASRLRSPHQEVAGSTF